MLDRPRDLTKTWLGPDNPARKLADFGEVARRRLLMRGFALFAGAGVLAALVVFTKLSFPAAFCGWLALAALAAIVPQSAAVDRLAAPAGATDAAGQVAAGQVAPGPLTAGHLTAGQLTAGPRAADSIWRVVVDAIPDAAMVIDARGYIVHHNARARDNFAGIRVGAPLSSVTRNPALLAAIDGIAASGDTSAVDLVERVPIERRFQATVSSLAVAGSPSGGSSFDEGPRLLLTFRDLTEQGRLAQMRADFIANASHELRTPLTSLRGFVETLQGSARDDPKARERFLGLMASQATRMTRLIDDLLSLSRIEMSAHIPPRGIVDLNEVAGYVQQTLQPLAEPERIKLDLALEPIPARIRGERDEIVQVMSNLVQNAIKYGRTDGHVRISITRAEAQGDVAPKVVLAVSDDGPGIAPEHLPRLTERFYRVSVASSREKGGTGLGLAIAKHIISRHRGTLKIASRVGEGSTFSVVFDRLP